MQGLRRLSVAMLIVLFTISPLAGWSLAAHIAAASKFADPAFQAQWQQGEAVTPNFYGPLATAHDGQQEAYKEAPGGQRLVQYFDKARMELNSTNGTVTSGLLATELVTGKSQAGDATFQSQAPAGISVAGDPNNVGPTYAQIGASGLTTAAASTVGQSTTRSLTRTGASGTFAAGGSDPSATIATFDDTTKHNVPKAFVDYRTKAGLLTIGLAIAEPFWVNGVLVGGQPKDVLVQAFERRVLTYTPSNPDAFKVEFGNIGSHYFTWRYAANQPAPVATNTPAPAATTAPTSVPTTPTSTPTTTASAPLGTFTISPSTIALADVNNTSVTVSGKVAPGSYFLNAIKPGTTASITVTPLPTDASGAFNFTVPPNLLVGTIGPVVAGAYTLTVSTTGDPNTALLTGALVVTGGSTAASPPSGSTSAPGALSVLPQTCSLGGSCDTTITVSGKLQPNTAYVLNITEPDNTLDKAVAKFTSDATGAFSTSGRSDILLNPTGHLVTGTYTLTVTTPDNTTPLLTGAIVLSA